MKNGVSDGSVVNLKLAATPTVAGVPWLLNGVVSVPATTAAGGEWVALHLEGEFEFDAVTNAAFFPFETIYWDNTAKKVTKVTTGNTKIGIATQSKGASEPTARVKLER